MRKAAGFLLVLLLATLVVITNSYGDGENDRSHQVHLLGGATYGPQITTCGDCHPAAADCIGVDDPYLCCDDVGIGTNCFMGSFTDTGNLQYTTVCNTCHSPDGAYDGVDDPDIGAKNNWSKHDTNSLVFDGSGDFLPGKKKWCVGCHDGVPSVINSVSAPNIAGESNSDCTAAGVPYACCDGLDTGTCVDYGYYHTGHGKFVPETFTCLACHDPDSEHVVDGDARTYSVTGDYQAGYRLKLVGGLAPLEIPRLTAGVTADQFRQCFSCHDSAPFINSDNYDTNFRADVDESNSCLDLDPPENKHWEHLNIATVEYDSDLDGGADSRPSCPACHNVHGPRLRVGGGINNAPGMIRTGELIGRESSLDLDYFINPCPDTTLSSTNETVDSTGGMMLEYSPTGFGTIARNGVCDMCHNEAEPYWRAAKTLPVQASNDFSGDYNAVALWSVDNGALTTDSIGTNTLTNYNTVGTDTVDYQEGDAGADFERDNYEALTIPDGSLASGFPLKSTENHGDISVTFWFKLESLNSVATLFSKWDTGAGARSLLLRNNNGTLDFFIGTNSGAGFELLNGSLSTLPGRWYHVGATFNNTTKAWTLRVWDDTAGGVALDTGGTAANNIAITNAAVGIGASHNSGTQERFIDSRMDEIVVFRDILTTPEIDQIRQGTYAEASPPTTTTTLLPTTTTTLSPPTTTTTLPGGTTTTTLPPGQNNFSGDYNAVAWWSVDNGALTTDSTGNGNTLNDNGTVGTNTVDYQEGDAGADFEKNNSQSLTIADGSLAPGFPLASTGNNGDISVTFWYKLESLNKVASLFSKWDTGAGARSLLLRDNNGQLDFFIGTNSGADFELLDGSLSTLPGRWYHVGATFDNTTQDWTLRVWDDTAGSVVLNTGGTAANNIAITSAAVGIGASHNSGTTERYFDGLIDEVVVFSDILTNPEIDQIRQGTYAEVSPPTTTTTTLPPGQNDFSGDYDAVALWPLDNGPLTDDLIGTNTLTDNNTVVPEYTDKKVGDASAHFARNNSESLTIADGSLAPGFPLASTGNHGDISVTFWYKKESNNSSAGLFSKWDIGAGARSLYIRDNISSLEFYIGTNFGAGYELLDKSLSTYAGRWYHVGATFNNTTKAWTLRVWDDTAGSVVLDTGGTAANNIAITNAAVAIGASHNSGLPERYFDGLIDEVVVFRDILTTPEIDQIRQGTYAPVSPTTTTTTTLPPIPNDFSLDDNAVALWSLENGALTTDSIGTNTLTDNNTVGTDTVDYKEATASADFERDNSQYLSIADGSLDSGFPLKGTESNGDISVTFWYKKESDNSAAGLFSKWDTGDAARSLLLRDNNGKLDFFIGTNSGAGYELLDNSLLTSVGRWYHVGATFNNTTKAWTLRVWDDTARSVALDTGGTAAKNIAITNAAVAIGASYNSGTPERYFDGLIDEVVIFRDILETGEIDQIRQGGYAVVYTTTTTTTTLPGGTTTTTTLPGGTTTTTTLPGGTTTTTTLPGGTTTTTLPLTPNDFSFDGNTKALWSLENGALTTDSIGTNTLADNGTVGTNTVDYKEATASADFEKNNSQSLTITDFNLDSGFPLKSGVSNGDISVTFWYKKESNNSAAGLFSKWDTGDVARSLLLRDNNGKLDFFIGISSGADYELLDNSLITSAGRWYHVGATFNNTTKAWKLRVWDDTAGSVVRDASGTAANNIAITSAAVAIGASHNSGTPERYFDGLIDEVAVFSDILTTGEIDRIRQGTYEDLCPGEPNQNEPDPFCGVCGQFEWGGYCIDNDISHEAHLTAASGPPIASCDVCHIDTFVAGGQFTDGQVFANTTVCNSCHSQLGAYNGVDSTSGSVGAKDNWATGVYDTVSGGLLLGKEKWCIGCHDENPAHSMVGFATDQDCIDDPGCALAPNMAGDDIEYGYYKTGHGKHGNEKINCLACHDPAVMHVDGVARTYSAAADNYQAGYRLKMVNGGVALDVPRSGQGTVEQFRLCFSCHDSAPYVNFDNPDTNFRSDVNDTCVPLNLANPSDEVNKHYKHLFSSPVWDSDWDGVPSDSAPSCTTCHNVHGPRLKAGATHAPAMIRTGELIGRYDEGALNLEYFTEPCRDQTTSLDNELLGSTGGVFMDDPLQLENPALRGGVCGMCHSTNEPYWRDANISILSCDKCHTNVPHTVVQIDTDNDLSYNAGYPCSNCHDGNNADLNGTPLDSWTDIESEHNVSTNGDGSCLTCHQSQRQEVIDAIALGAAPTNCLNCHSDKDHADHVYDHATNGGSLGYAPITVDTDCTTSCHSGDVVQQVHGGTCATCHTATYPDLLTSPNLAQFADSTTTCTECHNSGLALTKPFHGITSATVGFIHNLSSDLQGGSGYDCEACHTFADGPAQILAHMGTEAASSCDVCHSAADSPNTSATGVIATATAPPVTNLDVTCEQCHSQKGDYLLHGLSDDGGTDDVSSVHDNFLDENGFATSTCSNCHTVATEQDRLNLHTTTGSGSGNCLTCHQNLTDMGGITPQDIIDDGKGPGGGSQHCGACHISINTDWKNHTVDHTNFVLEDTNCTSCHDTNAGPNLTAPNSHATPYVGVGENHNPKGCYTCHDDSGIATRGNYLTLLQANQNGYVDAMPAGLTNPTCTNCHNIAYFDSHTHGTGTNHTVNYDGGVDQVGSGTGCVDCHTPISTWTEIESLHDFAGCATCHGYIQANGEHKNTPDGTVASVILASGPTTCASCHTEKAGQAHGVHPDDAFSWDSNCSDCHGAGLEAELVVSEIHGDTCTTCHSSASATRDNEMVGDAANGIDGDATQADGTALAAESDIGQWNTPTCTTCHNPATYTWEAIHTDTATAVDHSATVTNADTTCNGCHDASAGGTAPDAINTPFVGSGEVHNNNDGAYNGTCANCHTATGTLQAPPARAASLSATGGNCSACHDDTGVNYFESHTHDHSSTVDTPTNTTDPNTLNCLTSGCHIATTSPFEGAGEVHAAGTYAAGGCATCHTPATGALLADTAGDATGTTGECSNCHAPFASHQTHTPTNHAVTMGSDQSNGFSCNTSGCHATFTDDWGAAGGIYELHTSDCTLCHDSGRNDADGNVQTVIQGGAATCLNCHASKSAEHGEHPADAFSWDSNCSDCHGAGLEAELVVSEIHGGTCTLCHSGTPANRDNEMVGAATNGEDGDATQADGTALAAEGDIAQWNTPTCTTCHNPATYTWEAIHTDTATAVDHSATVTNADTTCNGCHDASAGGTAPDAINTPFVGSGEVHNNNDGAYNGTCANCHTATGTLQAAPARAASLSATGGNCSACHDDTGVNYFESHTHDHASTVDTPSNTTDPNTLNCLTSGCHVATTSPFEGAGEVHAAGTYAAGGCATCHTPATGALLADTAGNATGTTGECSNCHAPFASHQTHTPTNHAVTMGSDQSNGFSCNTSGCHGTFTNDWGAAGGIYELHTSDCTLCHDSGRNDADGNVQTVIQGGAATCLNCHASKSAEHGNPHPLNNFAFDSNCSDCHSGVNVVADVHKDTCTTCHSGAPATRENEMVGAGTNGIDGDATQADGTAAGATWGTVTCTTCHNPATYTWEAIHTDTATAVDHSATVTNADTTCNGCHDASAGGTAPDAINTPFVGSGEVHNNNDGAYNGTCANCHTATGTLQAAPARAASLSATGGNCSACHDDTGVNYFASHTHDHSSTVDTPTNTTDPNTLNCLTSGCHVATTSPFEGAGEVHAAGTYAAGGCATCHTPATGALLADTAGNATGTTGECSNCHAPFASHQTHTPTNHAVTMGSDQSNGQSCNTCHGTFTNDWGAAGGIYELHTSDCTLCHDSGRNDADGNVQTVIQSGAATCLNCHATKSGGHGNIEHSTYIYSEPDNGGAGPGVVKGLGTSCMVCHSGTTDPSLLNDDGFYIDTLHAGGGRGCQTCHNSPTGAGALVSFANPPYDNTSGSHFLSSLIDNDTASEIDYEAINGGHGGECVICHVPYSAASSHAVRDHDQLGNQNECDDCHTGYDSIPTEGEDIRTDIHGTLTCGSCHDTGAGYIMLAGTSAANHASNYGNTSSCTTCHDNHGTDFDGTTDGHFGTQPENLVSTNTHASNMTGASNCTTDCHNLGAGIYNVVHTTCTTCHTSASDGSLANRTTGDATQHDAVIDGLARTTSTCLTCHSKADPYDYNVDFQAHSGPDTHGNMVSNTTPKCDGCHGTGVDVKVLIHNDDCQNCHINITDNGSFQDGTELDSALADTVAGDATGHVVGTPNTDCLGCHSGYASNFVAHDATISNPSHSDSLTGSSKCTGCHSGADIVADVHYATSATDTDCENCHYDTQQPNTDGRLWDGSNANSVGGALEYGTAQGHVIGGPASTCINCHGSYDTDFENSHSTGGSHTNLTTSGAPECTDCHGTGDVITSIHAGGVGCEHCHTDMTLAGGTDGTLKGSATRYTGDSTTCLDCHTEIAGQFDHALHTASGANDTHNAMLANFNDDTTRSRDCDNCHTAADGNAVRDLHNGSIATARGSICEVCHENLTTDGRLRNNASVPPTTKGQASNHTIGFQSDCTTCHGLTFFAAHDYGSTHTGISYDGGTSDTAYTQQDGCAECHGNTPGPPYSLANWADIWFEHNVASPSLANGCVRCHDYDGTNGFPGYNTTDAAATLTAINDGAGVTETCATCHTPPAPNVDHSGPGQADDVLTILTDQGSLEWINDGNGATTGSLTVYAESTRNNGVCNYRIDYNGETTADMDWSTLNSRYEYIFTSTTFNGTLDNISITSVDTGCDAGPITATANNVSDSVSIPFGPGSSNTRATYDEVNGGTLTVWATHSYNDGSLAYEATYNGIDYPMNWNSGNSRYELNNKTGVGVYSTDVTVFSAAAGGDSQFTDTVENITVVLDVVTINSATWLTNGDGSTTGELVVCFSHSNNDGVCNYSLDYSDGITVSPVGWNTQVNCGVNEYEGVMSNVTWSPAVDAVQVSSVVGGCDTYTDTASNDVSDIITVTSASFNNDNLTVYATEFGDNPQAACEGATNAFYIDTDYTMTWTGTQFELVDEPVTGGYNGTGAKNDGQVTVHCASPGGDSVLYTTVTDDTPVSGNLLPEHFTHEASGYVKWGDLETTPVRGEGCFNCHDNANHGTPTGKDVVMDVHNGKCDLCHIDATGGGGALKWTTDSSDTYGNRLDINNNGNFDDDTIQTSGTCSSCHHAYWSQKAGIDLRHKTWNHHLSEDAQQGNCVHCHDSVRTRPVGSSWCVVDGSRVPKQPPCAYCHVDADKAYGSTPGPGPDVSDGTWQLQFFDFAADGFNTPLTKMTSTTHSIPNIDGLTSSPVVIHDFAVCFECHDKSVDYGAQNSLGDMMETMLDGNSDAVFNPTGNPNNEPNKVYPYHASGMDLDLNNASRTSADPGTFTWFPVDPATGYNATLEASAAYDNNAKGPIADDGTTFGPGVSDDLFFAYHYHPGRGGIIGTSATMGGVANQAGSFNILLPVMTPYTASNPKYYQEGSEEGLQNKNFYKPGKAYNADYTYDNFGTGGGSAPTATCNPSGDDGYNVWNFCGKHNVPYTNYKMDPTDADNADIYWVTVPKFDDIATPAITDVVRLLTVDCVAQTVTARTKLTGDYNLHRTDVQYPSDWVNWTGDVKITSPETVDMTYDGLTDTWTGSLSAACANPDTVTVTSYIGNSGAANGSASIAVP